MELSTPTAEHLLSWYSATRAKWLDLVGDYAGKERFFVEGDSLLLECFSNPQLDFDPGFQVLHSVFLVEQLLQNLLKRGCVFDVVFFQGHEQNCLPQALHTSRYLLTREIIITHLRNSTSQIGVFHFHSIEDVAFQEYLDNSAVYFALCSDGARYSSKHLLSLTPKAHLDDNISFAIDEKTRARLRAIIYQLKLKNLDIALLNGLEFEDSKVFAFVLDSKSRHAAHAEDIEKEILLTTEEKGVEKPPNPPGDRDAAQISKLVSELVPKVETVLRDFGIHSTSSRMTITLIALRQLVELPEYRPMISACLLHTMFLETLKLSDRAIVSFEGAVEESYSQFVDVFAERCLQILPYLGDVPTADASIIDMFDGRLFHASLEYFAAGISLPHIWQKTISRLLDFVFEGRSAQQKSSGALSRSSHSQQHTNGVLPTNSTTDFDGQSILPFSHPAFDKYLPHIKLRIESVRSERNRVASLDVMKCSKKTKPAKAPVLAVIPQKSEAFVKKKAMRSHQRFMADMLSYAASLTNAGGKSLTPELIIVGDRPKANIKPAEDTSRRNLMSGSKPGAQQKKQGQASIRGKIAAESAQLSKKREDTTFAAWVRVREAIDHEANLAKKYNLVLTYSRDLSGRKDLGNIPDEVELYKITVLIQIWAAYSRKGHHVEGKNMTAALIYDGLLRLHSSDRLTSAILKAANEIASLCGMTLPPRKCDEGRPLSFKIPAVAETDLDIGIDPLDFKLMYMGPYMERAMDQADDSRVSFRPDAWQRKVLDELDAGRSLLVVAPTSSGKTFISFYAMEKVLRASDDGVIIYIAPTKALVNQIAAEVQARFTKNYEFAGTSIYAIKTRDHKLNNPKAAQVLVTVPEMLQIMLMSPNNLAWVKRIKTIIFDEVHSIGQAEDGMVWEQLLLMAPCQIVALSATVGNSDAFASWLSSSQAEVGRSFTKVEHQVRFSDLRKYMFKAPDAFEFTGLPEKPFLAPLGLEELDGLVHLHPICCLSHPQRGIPPDLELESRDCYLLWQAMKKLETPQYPVHGGLAPKKFFHDTVIKSDTIRWAAELKVVLSQWMKDPKSPFKEVVAELSKPLPQPNDSISALPQNETFDDSAESESNELLGSTLPLLCRLQSGNALPAILFNFDRTACEDIVRNLQQQLSKAETNYKETDAAWKAKLDKYAVWKKASEAQKLANKKMVAKKSKKVSGQDRDEQRELGQGDTSEAESSQFETFDPEKTLQKFSFADPKKADAEELEKILDRFRWVEIDPSLIDAFQRGIAVHHSGMNRRYRQAVEIWFRKGFLTVVVATGTLSLGINMPCKTVVFSGDSVYLTALNFRQSAGRSGRRGFDLLGNVVFQNISTPKACRLLSSRLPDINGYFPLTANFVLRLLALLQGTHNAPYAMNMVESLLAQPRLYLGGENLQHQVLHHVRFSIEYLRVQGLVTAKGESLNFAQCIRHLSFEENGAFAMHALFRDEYFHDLADGLLAHEEDTLRTLMLVVANLFGRKGIRAVMSESKIESVKASSSVVFLPPMPEEATKILKNHEARILETYTTYVKTFVDEHCRDPDNKLPFTGVEIQPNGTSDLQETSVLRQSASQVSATLRSPFVALSGHGDSFSSISDLCTSVRDGVFLEKAVIPHLDLGAELQVPLNAYLYDFYIHGNVHEIVHANGVLRGDIWYYLDHFSLVLATIVASLENVLKGDDGADLDMTNVGALGDEIELELDDKDESQEDQSGTLTPTFTGTTAVSSGASTPVRRAAEQPLKPKKTKVADSWDDEASDEAQEDESDGEEGEDKTLTEQEEKRLKMVYVMFKKLKEEFDIKFRAMWA